MNDAGKRTWADVVVLVVSILLIGVSVWPSFLSENPEAGAFPKYALSAGSGVLALLGLWLTQKNRMGAGRSLVAVAGLAVLVLPFVSPERGMFSLVYGIVTGLSLLAGSMFIGPMPPPQRHI